MSLPCGALRPACSLSLSPSPFCPKKSSSSFFFLLTFPLSLLFLSLPPLLLSLPLSPLPLPLLSPTPTLSPPNIFQLSSPFPFHHCSLSAMDSPSNVVSLIFLFLTLLSLSSFSSAALRRNPLPKSPSSTAALINSNSILVALLDSHYTELAELVEKALLLQTLEDAVGKYNLTIFAPRNEALERELDPEFKRFLLEPRSV